MKHLDETQLRLIAAMMPPDSHFVVIVATKEGSSVDTDILDRATAKAFVLETGNEMAAS